MKVTVIEIKRARNNPPTTDPPTYGPTDLILTEPTVKILFKRPANRKIPVLQNSNASGKC